jgi:hypothetical protein
MYIEDIYKTLRGFVNSNCAGKGRVRLYIENSKRSKKKHQEYFTWKNYAT